MSLITNADIKTYLGITEATYDATITAYIGRVESEIKDMIGQSVEKVANFDIIFKGNGKPRYLLNNSPVTAINSLSYRATPIDSWVVIASSDYTMYQTENLYWVYYSSFSESYEYKANIDYGYTNVPEVVKQVAIEMTVDKLLDSNALAFNEQFRHGLVSRAESVNGYTGTTTFKTADYWHRLGKYAVVLK